MSISTLGKPPIARPPTANEITAGQTTSRPSGIALSQTTEIARSPMFRSRPGLTCRTAEDWSARGDLTEDGRPDLFVANDGTPCWLFANRGGLKFEETGLAAGSRWMG